MVVSEPPTDSGEWNDPLEVWLSVRPSEECDCQCREREVRSVQQAVSTKSDGSYQCSLLVNIGTDQDTTYVQTEVKEPCPRAILDQCECIPSLEEIRDGSLVFSVTIPRRGLLPAIVDQLREEGVTVSVMRIRVYGGDNPPGPLLTEKQRAAFELAVESGYYDSPRNATLNDIADGLGISRSAASQRLRSVRRRLIKQYTARMKTTTD
jgi:hypothetical protein